MTWHYKQTEKTPNGLDCLIMDDDRWIGWAYSKDDATLMAAAPELLLLAEALESAIQHAGHNLNSTATEAERSRFIKDVIDVWNYHYPAISKAKGEQ